MDEKANSIKLVEESATNATRELRDIVKEIATGGIVSTEIHYGYNQDGEEYPVKRIEKDSVATRLGAVDILLKYQAISMGKDNNQQTSEKGYSIADLKALIEGNNAD